MNTFTIEGAFYLGAGGGCGAEPIPLGEKRDGAYAMVSYDTKWNLQAVVKFEYFDPNIDVKDIEYHEMFTVGAN